ncbi:HD domain-containing protein [Haliangium sp.]|uniref:Ppx/GppA phosphatase family protein n=1 Tax=Haliangium sp. TaxID=2663208 RepID=UPI003D0E5357
MTTHGTAQLGAIDAGTNAIRMVIADAGDPHALATVEYVRVPVRLGHGTFTRGELDADTVNEAVAAMTRFRELFDQHGVSRYRAVATSAVRNAHNRDAILHRLYHEAGIELEVIDGEEEARLVRKAVLHGFAERPPPRLILDLGGGSLEVNVHDGLAWRSSSLPVGTVRLLETFGLSGVISHDEAGMVRRYAATLVQSISPRPPPGLSPAAVCGGNAETLAALFGDLDPSGMPGFELEALERALPEILDADVDTRMARFGVRRDRAEVMGVAALVLATVGRSLQLTRLCAPGVGIRDALLLDLAEGLAVEQAAAASARGKALLTAARTFAGRLGHDLTHGEQVRRLARSMFDQLGDVHGLDPSLGVVLEVAALLHDVGEVVHTRSHHKHSEYMIRWGRIPGLDSPWREMVATLVRTHRKSPPDLKKHEHYASLDKAQRQTVRKLAALLRLADGLDTDHRQRVDRVVVGRLGDTITFDLVLRDDAAAPAEPDRLLRKSRLFEEELGYRVTMTVGPAAVRPV